MLLPMALFAQDATAINWDGVLTDLPGKFTDFFTITAFAMGLTEALKGWLKIKGTGALVLSWGISLPISLAGYFLKLGLFAGLELWAVAVYAVGIALVANAVFKAPFVKIIMDAIFKYATPKK